MFKRFFVALTLSLSCALLLVGCGSSETTTNGSNQTSSNKTTTTTTTSTPATTTTTPATTTTTTPATTTAGGGSVGVPECDEFINKYEACITGKVPEAARAQWNTALQTWRTEWKKLADNPQTRATLASVCKQQADASRQSMKPFGCEF